jgi:hypothetical protein
MKTIRSSSSCHLFSWDISNRQSALSQEILDIPAAQGEPEVEPDSVPDDIWRKLVVGIGNGLHGLNCYHIRRPICSLTCQCPNGFRSQDATGTGTTATKIGIVIEVGSAYESCREAARGSRNRNLTAT